MSFPTLEITADFGGSTGQVTGTFELGPDTEVTEELNVEFIIGGAGQLVTALFDEYITGDVTTREGIFVDLGAGSHVFEIGVRPATGTDSYQWGDDGTADAVTATDATGGTAAQKAQVLLNYLRQGSHVADSVSPATLSYEEFSSGGVLDGPLDVAIPVIRYESNQDANPSTRDVALTCVETADLSIAQDITELLGY